MSDERHGRASKEVGDARSNTAPVVRAPVDARRRGRVGRKERAYARVRRVGVGQAAVRAVVLNGHEPVLLGGDGAREPKRDLPEPGGRPSELDGLAIDLARQLDLCLRHRAPHVDDVRADVVGTTNFGRRQKTHDGKGVLEQNGAARGDRREEGPNEQRLRSRCRGREGETEDDQAEPRRKRTGHHSSYESAVRNLTLPASERVGDFAERALVAEMISRDKAGAVKWRINEQERY